MIKDRSGKNLTEAEEIKWQKHIGGLYRQSYRGDRILAELFKILIDYSIKVLY